VETNVNETPSPLALWIPCALWTAFWLIVLLVSGWRAYRPGIWVAKPLASAGFIAAALACGAAESAYGLAILAALVLSFLGDVLLIPEGAGPPFLAGLASFLLGHVGFAVAFLVSGVSVPGAALTAVVLAAPIVLVLRWLGPHVPRDMKAPVWAYVAVISAMLIAAAGATLAGGTPGMLAGAALFYLSDLAVARDRFVSPGYRNGLVGLPLYYGAQLVLAATVVP
jgi:uncharacterized membrane protein YhhN